MFKHLPFLNPEGSEINVSIKPNYHLAMNSPGPCQYLSPETLNDSGYYT